MSESVDKVRACLVAVKPAIKIDEIEDDTPLLEERVITSLDVVDLLLHLENASGHSIRRDQLQPGSFRDIATIARVFIDQEPAE